MIYAEARPLIRNGDLVAVKRRNGLLPILTRLVTNSPYTHTGVAVWSDGRLLMAQANGGGVNLAPLSQEASTADFDVYGCPVDGAAAVLQAWLLLDTRTYYSFADLWRIFLFMRLGIALPKNESGGMICSTLSARIYQFAGWAPEGMPSIPWPAAIVTALRTRPRLEVMR